MNESLQTLAVATIVALAPALLALAGWLAAKLAGLINANVANKAVSGVLLRLDYAALNGVKAIEQAMVSAVRGSDGSLAPDAAARAKTAAVNAARSLLGPRGIDEVMRVLGLAGPASLDTLIGQRIEAAVGDMKTAAAATPVAVARPSIPPPPGSRAQTILASNAGGSTPPGPR